MEGVPPALKFTVFGKPQPRGSKRSIPMFDKDGQPRRNQFGRMMVATKDDNPKSGEWMQAIAGNARRAMAQAGVSGLIDGPVELRLTFVLARPKNDFRKSGEVKPGARSYPTSKPDTLKLTRGVEDAMKDVVYRDDAQVVNLNLRKRYGNVPGVLIEIWCLPATFGETPADFNCLDMEIQHAAG